MKTFFLRSPDFDRNIASIRFKTDENLNQVRLLLFPASKKSPSFAKSWPARMCKDGSTERYVQNLNMVYFKNLPYWRNVPKKIFV